MPKVNRTAYAILGMLSFKPMSGYDMKKAFDESVAHFWNENYGHIYPVLKRLEHGGLVTKETVSTQGKPSRYVYSITEKGTRHLVDWLLLPAERPTLRIELLLKLFFGHLLPPQNLIEKIEEELKFCKQILRRFDEIEQHVSEMRNKSEFQGVRYGLISLRYGQHYYSAVQDWCEETIDILKKTENVEGGNT